MCGSNPTPRTIYFDVNHIPATMKFHIEGVVNLDGSDAPCKGSIEVFYRINKIAYIEWDLFDGEGNSLAAVAQKYFVGDKEFSKASILTMVIESILSYRIERKKVFTEMRLKEHVST
jgi:hypothetical protein